MGKCPTADKMGKCPTVARGGGGRVQLELTDALTTYVTVEETQGIILNDIKEFPLDP